MSTNASGSSGQLAYIAQPAVVCTRSPAHDGGVGGSIRLVQIDERVFEELAEQWRKQTGMLSSVSKNVEHWAYQKIIAMGEPAVPFILRELRDRPGQWFKALKTITGQSPVPAQNRADFRTARQAWLDWGKERGHIQ